MGIPGQFSVTINTNTDLSKATGTVEISTAATAGTEILSVNDNATVLLSADMANGLEINADDDVTTTATTFLQGTLNLTLSNDQSGTIVIDKSAASTDGFDTVNVTATAAQTSGLDITGTAGASGTTINVLGSEAVTIAAGTDAKIIDGSSMTGALTAASTATALEVVGGSGNDVLSSGITTTTAKLTGNAGNDQFTISAAYEGTIAGGDGTDTIEMSGARDISAATITSIEVLDMNANDTTVDEALLNGEAIVVSSTGGTAALTVGNINASLDLGSLQIADTLTTVVNFNANKDGSLGAAQAVNVTGSSVTDTITGHDGADTLLGGAGADSLTGDDGADYLDGGAGNDTTISGGNGADTIFGGAGNDSGVDGGAGDDVIDGGAGNDTLNGGADDDTITGGEGADTIDGDAGEDSIILTESSSAVDTVVVSAVVGTSSDSGSKTVTGNDNNIGEDTLTGFAFGSDVIKVVATSAVSFVHGTDTEIGTADADAAATGINGDYATTVGLIDLDNDGVYTGADDVVLNFASPNAALTEARFEAALQYDVVLADGAAQTFTSGGLNDVIQSGDDADVIDGGAGTDTYKFVAAADSTITDAGSAHAGQDIVTITVGDIFDHTAADIDAVIAADIAEGTAVDANGDDLLVALSAAFAGADDGVANIEAGVINFSGGDQFLVIDIDSSETIEDSDIIVELTGYTVTGLTLTSGDAVIA